MSVDLPSPSSRPHAKAHSSPNAILENTLIEIVELPKISTQTSCHPMLVSQNFRLILGQAFLTKILPVFFFLGGVLVMAKIFHGQF